MGGEFAPFKNEKNQKMVKYWIERSLVTNDLSGYDYNFTVEKPFKIGYKLQTMNHEAAQNSKGVMVSMLKEDGSSTLTGNDIIPSEYLTDLNPLTESIQ